MDVPENTEASEPSSISATQTKEQNTQVEPKVEEKK